MPEESGAVTRTQGCATLERYALPYPSRRCLWRPWCVARLKGAARSVYFAAKAPRSWAPTAHGNEHAPAHDDLVSLMTRLPWLGTEDATNDPVAAMRMGVRRVQRRGRARARARTGRKVGVAPQVAHGRGGRRRPAEVGPVQRERVRLGAAVDERDGPRRAVGGQRPAPDGAREQLRARPRPDLLARRRVGALVDCATQRTRVSNAGGPWRSQGGACSLSISSLFSSAAFMISVMLRTSVSTMSCGRRGVRWC